MSARVTLEQLVLGALERELAAWRAAVALPVDLAEAGDVLATLRPSTPRVRGLAAACWLAADARTVRGAAEALSVDGDVEAWVASEAREQGVEVSL